METLARGDKPMKKTLRQLARKDIGMDETTEKENGRSSWAKLKKNKALTAFFGGDVRPL